MNTATLSTPEERDLSFESVNNPIPRTLSVQQIHDYNQVGYLKPFDIYNGLQAQCNRAYFDYLLAKLKAMNNGRDSYVINGYHTRCQGIHDMATHPAILDMVQDIVGPDIICWATHFFCKLPYDPKAVPWHQDASYWPLTPARTVTVWLAIDDADVENACIHVIPATHRQGTLPWEEATDPAVLNQKIVNIEQYGHPIPFELKAGQISIHADMLAHGSTPNPSDRRHCGLTIRYCPPIVRATNSSWTHNAIICRGSDTTGKWHHHQRPLGDDLPNANKPKSIGGN